MKHIMVDLETLSTQSNAVIVSIGMVLFDSTTTSLTITNENYIALASSKDNINEQIRLGRHVDANTIAWWMKQGDMARNVFNVRGAHLYQMLHDIGNFILNVGEDVILWGNGANFDNVILRSFFETAGMTPPTPFYNDGCYRTIKNTVGKSVPFKRQGIYHNALDGAISQANHLIEINNKVGGIL